MIPRLLKPVLLPVITILMGTTIGVGQTSDTTLFRLLPSRQTGVSFNNLLTESDTLNILNQANIYNGSGVGIGDFNNDGFVDIYFAANMVSNKLYLNRGTMQFEDITNTAGVDGHGRWSTGVSVVDINADGRLDIHVSCSFTRDAKDRRNLLYINQGNNKEGIPYFSEEAVSFGIADTGFSTQGYFFDYDKDGDLDLYLVTNELNDPKTPIRFRPKVMDGSARNTDRLYRNNGNGSFSNVSREAGILIEGWGHAACISDFNKDGWPDVYVANDFAANDILYINNRDGTFTNRLAEYFKHTSWYAMGTDAVDINNDGLVDVLSLEMLPETNMRKKRMLSGNEYYNYTNAARYGYEHQYIRNVLQVNSGTNVNGHPLFSEVAFMSGLYQTDWSWCPLVADFDNDGHRDIVITNGLPRDVTDLDYISYDNGQAGNTGNFSLAMVDSLPIVKIANYAFKNKGGLQFENSSERWGFTRPSFSNGAAYADLDNDGDLDIVISNLNEEAFIYENRSAHKESNHLRVTIKGTADNSQGIGAVIRAWYGANQQVYYEHQPTRGYLSTHDATVHLGTGNAQMIDSLCITWPDQSRQWLHNIKTGQTITLDRLAAIATIALPPGSKPLFSNTGDRYGLSYKPVEMDFVDYNIQTTLPHKLSQYGPGIAVGDIDGNGWDDLYLGGSSGNAGQFFLQDNKGKFRHADSLFLQTENILAEDMGVLFFDADMDKDLDLYIVSGSYELPPNHPVCQDRLYLNDGKGRFKRDESALPAEFTNGSCVRAADFDGDGDLDLFVGGRVVSGAYPSAPQSFILQNNGGRFTDVTEQYCPGLQHIGMVTDALWSDFDNDGKTDLVLAGEWMPVTFFRNTGKTFTRSVQPGIDAHTGWWNSLTAGDYDNDGDIDYVAGNLGLNSNFKATPEQPMHLMAKDLDQNGSLDAMVFCYMKAEDGSMQPFPMHTRDDLTGQLIATRKKYPTHQSYGTATMDQLWSDKDRTGALSLVATDMRSSYIENLGNGKFSMTALPGEAQVAPVYGMMSQDINGDGNLDLLLAGNDFGMEPYSGRHDALNGVCLQGDGKGGFITMQATTGFTVIGDAKGFSKILNATNGELLIVSQNQDSLLVFSSAAHNASKPRWISLQPLDAFADIRFRNGKKRRVEFYHGSTYLSQSHRKLQFEQDMISITITNSRGVKRNLLSR